MNGSRWPVARSSLSTWSGTSDQKLASTPRSETCRIGSGSSKEVEKELELSRLAAETTLGRESMPEAEKRWLRENRPPEAKHWNVLSSLTASELPYAS